MNRDLDKKVAQRTSELAAANEKLETEISERKRAQDDLRTREEQLRITLSSIGDAVIATDTQRRVTRMNRTAEALTGWEFDQARGRALDEVFTIVNEQTGAPAKDPVARVIATGKIEGLANHTVLVSRDRTERPIADSAAPIRAASGEIVGVVLVFRDVTKERQDERQREQLIHDLGERMKELSCLYGLSRIVERGDITLQEIFEEVTMLLPPAWRYPEIACGRICYGDKVFEMHDGPQGVACQSADIQVEGEKIGSIEVCYCEPRPEADEGPFLAAERDLLNAIAERLGRISERMGADEKLRNTLAKVEQFNQLAVGRELRMIELKREVNEMARKAQVPPPYDAALVRCERPDSRTAGTEY